MFIISILCHLPYNIFCIIQFNNPCHVTAILYMRSPPLSTYPAQCQQVFARVRIGHVITVRNCVHGESAYLSPAMAPIYGSRFLPTMSCGQSKQRPRLQQYRQHRQQYRPNLPYGNQDDDYHTILSLRR